MPTLHEARILVVDDEPVLCEIFAKWLAHVGCGNVATAANGAEALASLQQNPTDILLTDVRMPVMDGVTLVRRLAALGLTIPSIIFVSGFADVDEKEMYALGVEAFLSKPTTREVLVDILERAIANRSALWLKPFEALPRQTILVKAQSVGTDMSSSGASGKSGFCLGRGGFSAVYPFPITLGRVAFRCVFHADLRELSGQGQVRWHSRGDGTVGIEFHYLDPSCRDWLVEELSLRKPRSFIPIL